MFGVWPHEVVVLTLGLMRKRTHMRKYTELGESYRWEIEAAARKERLAKDELHRYTRGLIPGMWIDRNFMDPSLVKVVVTINQRSVNALDYGDALRLLSQAFQACIMDLVYGTADSRGDMRQTDAQRLLRLS